MVSSESSRTRVLGALHPELPKGHRPAGITPQSAAERTSLSQKASHWQRGTSSLNIYTVC